jgi:hypothetical protein
MGIRAGSSSQLNFFLWQINRMLRFEIQGRTPQYAPSSSKTESIFPTFSNLIVSHPFLNQESDSAKTRALNHMLLIKAQSIQLGGISRINTFAWIQRRKCHFGTRSVVVCP